MYISCILIMSVSFLFVQSESLNSNGESSNFDGNINVCSPDSVLAIREDGNCCNEGRLGGHPGSARTSSHLNVFGQPSTIINRVTVSDKVLHPPTWECLERTKTSTD